jgi:hypothetical protein
MRRRYIAGLIDALLFAALVPALVMSWLADSLLWMTIALWVALAHAILLGLPVFLILQRYGRVNAFSFAGAVFIIGCLPLGLSALPSVTGSGLKHRSMEFRRLSTAQRPFLAVRLALCRNANGVGKICAPACGRHLKPITKADEWPTTSWATSRHEGFEASCVLKAEKRHRAITNER